MSVNVIPPYRTRQAAMTGAVALSVVIMGGKFYAYWLTGSTAILSDALESIINVVASGFGLFSVILAAKPPDATHPYGHGKIEYFAAGFEGALIILAAASIVVKAGPQIFNPRPLPLLGSGLAVLAAASVLNLALGIFLVRLGRRTRSLILVADGKHVLTDVYTSAGVLAGLGVVWWTGQTWLDGAIALAVAVNIVATGAQLLRQSAAGLMDASDAQLLQEIAAILRNHRKDKWIDIHQLRARRAGDRVLLDFHLIIPRDLSLEEGHREVKDLEEIFRSHFNGLAESHIHLDPCQDLECPLCGYRPCRHRLEDTRQQRLWSPQVITAPPDQEPPPTPPEDRGA